MSPTGDSKLTGATTALTEVNQLLVAATALVPIFGGLISGVIAIAARHRADPAKIRTLADGIARMTAELDRLAANDAAWRVEHPET
jgi:hypothetical protein